MERIDNLSSSNRSPRKRRKKEKNFFDGLVSTAGFMAIMGLLIIGTGLICYMAFGNEFSRLVLDLGLILTLSGLVLKVTDIFLKIIGGRV